MRKGDRVKVKASPGWGEYFRRLDGKIGVIQDVGPTNAKVEVAGETYLVELGCLEATGRAEAVEEPEAEEGEPL